MSVIWKSIPGWEGYYSASNTGLIRSEERTITRKNGGKGTTVRYKQKLMSLCKNGNGYYSFPAMREGRRKTLEIHRCVFQAHVRPLKLGEHVDHIDSNKLNNNISNLQALTEYDHKCLTQKRIKEKCGLADFLTLLWIISNSPTFK